MKRVLITGANSYIGQSFESYMKSNHAGEVSIDTLDMKNAIWRESDFSGYDVVFHVAGIAHADVSHVTEETKRLYYSVNTTLAVETAQKAKKEGVHQFIFMSSMIVYGKHTHVTADTLPDPENFYGDSKWQADRTLQTMADERFLMVILRPPMIYGKGSKGNYPTLAKLARKLPVFPKTSNRRSMLYVENLCEFIRIMIEEERSGVFFPQNGELVSTSDMVGRIAEVKGHGICVTALLSPFASLGKKMPGKIGRLCKKAFGDSYYDSKMSEIGRDYRVADLKESIRRTEGNAS